MWRKLWRLPSKCGGALCLGPFAWMSYRKSGLSLCKELDAQLWFQLGWGLSLLKLLNEFVLLSTPTSLVGLGPEGICHQDTGGVEMGSGATVIHSCSSSQKSTDLYCSLYLARLFSSNLSLWLDSVGGWVRIWKWLRHGRVWVEQSTLLPVLVPSYSAQVRLNAFHHYTCLEGGIKGTQKWHLSSPLLPETICGCYFCCVS